MAVVLGTDGYRYEVSDNWAKLPPGMEFNADVAAVGVDKNDNVYAFNRGKHPMCVFDRDGNLLRTWGEGIFLRPHGVFMAPDGTIWLTDDGDHTVRQCTLDGKVLLTIGIPGKPAPYMSGEPFHRCTHTAMSPQWRQHLCLGRLRQFARPQIHARRQAADVLGRARHRPRPVQHRPQCLLRPGWLGLCRRPREPPGPGVRRQRQVRGAVEQHAPPLRPLSGDRASRAACISARSAPDMAVNIDLPGCGPRVSIYTRDGKLLARLGHEHAGLEHRPVHLAARARRRLRAATSMSARSLHQLGPPRPRQGRRDPARPAQPAEAGQSGLIQWATPSSAWCSGWRRSVRGLQHRDPNRDAAARLRAARLRADRFGRGRVHRLAGGISRGRNSSA